MAAIHLSVEQINCQAEISSFDAISDTDCFENLVNPDLDLHSNKSMDKECISEESKHEYNSGTSISNAQSSSIEQVPRFEDSDITKHSALSEGDYLYSYDSVDATYPNISLPVAQYITQNNPHIFQKAADLLDRQENSSNNPKMTSSPPSPLKSMSNTSEALALQQSVIGKSPVKPVSPEVVAEIVANTRLHSTHMTFNSVLPNNKSSSRCTENVERKTSNESEKLLPINTMPVIYNELVKYPPHSITASIEKKSWFSGLSVINGTSSAPSSPAHSIVKTQHSKSRSRKSSQSSSTSSKQSRKTPSVEMVSTHHNRKNMTEEIINRLEKERNGKSPTNQLAYSNHSYISEPDTSSIISDKYESESTFSEVFDTESTVSETSGLDEEMFQIKKLLVNVSNSSIISNNINNTEVSLLSNCMDKKLLTTETQTINKKCNQATETDTDSELFEVLREKARLEGHLQSIKDEMEMVIKERTNLQKTIALIEAQLQMQMKETALAVKEKEISSKEYERLQRECKQWDHVISEYQSVIEAKNLEIKALKEDLSETETTNEKFKITTEELNIDLESKEGAVVGLKNKIAELHVEVQTLLQGKVELENDVKNIKAEMETFQKSKEWYQEQLYSVQENRNKIHQELIMVKANCVSLTNLVDQLKTENNQIKQRIVDTQQRAVKEKEVLKNHLENIEADMMERESLFQQLEKDHGNAEEILTERVKKIEEERIKLTSTVYKVSDLEHQVEVLKHDLQEREQLLTKQEKNNSELTKRITLLQKSINEKDLTLQQWEQNYKLLEQKMKHADLELNVREEQIFVLKSEKTAIEVALAAANEEKRNVDEALKGVKDNLNRVENSFKQMRTELVSKSSQVEQLLKEKFHLEDTYQKLEEHSLQQKRNYESQTSFDNQNQEVLVHDLKKRNQDLEQIITVQQKDIQSVQKTYLNLEKEKENLLIQINNLQLALEKSEKLNETISKQCDSLQSKLNLSQTENMNIVTDQMKHKANEIDKKFANKMTFENLHHLQDALKLVHQEHKEKHRVYESNIKILTRKLKEKIKEIKRLKEGKNSLSEFIEIAVQTDSLQPDTEICSEKDTNLDLYKQKVQELEEQLNTLSEQRVNIANEKSELENEKLSEEYNEKIKELEEELSTVKKMCKEQEEEIEKSKLVILELEKEKGQLSGMSDNHNALKVQLSELESQLVSKESSISYLEQQVQSIEQHHIEEENKVKSKIETVEKDLLKEKAVIKELRHQVFQEKRENSHLKRQIAGLKSGLEQANQMADSRSNEITNLNKEHNAKLQTELKYKADVEQLQIQCRQKISTIEQLKKELEETKARDPALAEQIKALSWHCKEKNQEVVLLKEQIKSVGSRNSEEVKALNERLQATEIEMENIKTELANCRREKFSYQAKVTELRNALKSTVAQNKQFRQQITNYQEQTGSLLQFSLPESPVPYDDKFIASLLQQSSILPESRPLSNLQACLNSLKQEMAVLQKQLEDHEQTKLNSTVS